MDLIQDQIHIDVCDYDIEFLYGITSDSLKILYSFIDDLEGITTEIGQNAEAVSKQITQMDWTQMKIDDDYIENVQMDVDEMTVLERSEYGRSEMRKKRIQIPITIEVPGSTRLDNGELNDPVLGVSEEKKEEVELLSGELKFLLLECF